MTYPISAAQAYYAVARDKGRAVALCGPYTSHATAARALDVARRLVLQRYPHDSRAAWADYGVALVPVAASRPVRTAFDLTEVGF